MTRPRGPSRRPLLAAVLLASCGGGGESSDGAGDRPAQRLLVVGWDGATFDLVDPLLEAGRLPHLARLVAAGRTAWLESTKVPISSAAWIGAATGHGPGETGIYDFFQRTPESHELQVIDSRANRRPPIWRILSGRGLGVIVWGVPITWPPEPVNGTLVAGMLSPPGGEYAWPPGYAGELRARGFVPDIGMWTKLQRRMSTDRARVLEQLAIKERAVLEQLGRPDWDFSMVVFKCLDVVSHYLYDGTLDGAAAQLLVRLDEVLGAMLAAAGPDTNVLVVSDHGFGTYPFAFNVSRWLLERGYTVESGAATGEPVPDMPLAEYKPALDRRRLSAIDFARTRALATGTECEGNYGSLRLQVQGRDPAGIVPPGEVDALLEEIEAALVAFAPAGRPIVTRTWRGAELYPGPAREAVPDLIFETVSDHMVIANDEDATVTRYESPRPEHRLDGILVASGPGIARDAGRERFQVLDVAPIALHLLDQPLYEEMTGDPRPHLLARPRPVRRMAEADDATLRPRDRAWDPPELSDAERAAQRELLNGLGYGEGDARDE